MLKVLNVSKSFPIDGYRTQKVLADVSFTLDKGERATIAGPSGSGKSTLLNIIGTLDQPDRGSVCLNDLDLNKLPEKDLASIRNNQLGFIFQSHQLLSQLSLLENVLVPTIPQMRDAKKRARIWGLELLDFVGLSDHINKLPGQMSGGECQRTAVVRSLINKPELLLADEPTGSLDEKNAQEISNLLMKLNKVHGITMIVVTHSNILAKTIGNIHYLGKGNISKS